MNTDRRRAKTIMYFIIDWKQSAFICGFFVKRVNGVACHPIFEFPDSLSYLIDGQ